MKIKTVKIRASEKYPHPSQQFSNLMAEAELEAEIEEGESWEQVAYELQMRVQTLVLEHKETQIQIATARQRILAVKEVESQQFSKASDVATRRQMELLALKTLPSNFPLPTQRNKR